VNIAIGEAIGGMIEAGFIRPIVGERFPLERAVDALHTLEQRRATGKIVLDVRAG
jgi:NADPH:quinone reductase